MTPEINSQTEKIILEFLQDIRSMKDFTIEQAPDVLREMVAYEATMAWIGCLPAAFIFLAWVGFIWWAIKDSAKVDRSTPEGAKTEQQNAEAGCAVTGLALVASMFFLCMYLPTAIQATFFPKWFIVEKLLDVLK